MDVEARILNIERRLDTLERTKGRQARLAQEVGVTREHLNSVLRGRVRPGGRLAVKLEAATGVPLSTWLTGTPDEVRAAWSAQEAKPGETAG